MCAARAPAPARVPEGSCHCTVPSLTSDARTAPSLCRVGQGTRDTAPQAGDRPGLSSVGRAVIPGQAMRDARVAPPRPAWPGCPAPRVLSSPQLAPRVPAGREAACMHPLRCQLSASGSRELRGARPLPEAAALRAAAPPGPPVRRLCRTGTCPNAAVSLEGLTAAQDPRAEQDTPSASKRGHLLQLTASHHIK